MISPLDHLEPTDQDSDSEISQMTTASDTSSLSRTQSPNPPFRHLAPSSFLPLPRGSLSSRIEKELVDIFDDFNLQLPEQMPISSLLIGTFAYQSRPVITGNSNRLTEVTGLFLFKLISIIQDPQGTLPLYRIHFVAHELDPLDEEFYADVTGDTLVHTAFSLSPTSPLPSPPPRPSPVTLPLNFGVFARPQLFESIFEDAQTFLMSAFNTPQFLSSTILEAVSPQGLSSLEQLPRY